MNACSCQYFLLQVHKIMINDKKKTRHLQNIFFLMRFKDPPIITLKGLQ